MNKRLTVFLFSLLLGGCIGKTTKPASFYVIDAPASIESLLDTGKKGPGIKITALSIPPYLERKQIVTRKTANQLHFSEQHRWAGKFRKNLARVMAKNLSGLLANAPVTASRSDLPISAEYQLGIEVTQFERDESGSVVLSADWRIVRVKDMRSVASGSETIKSQALPDINDYGSIVTVMSEIYSQLAVVIARSLIADGHPAR